MRGRKPKPTKLKLITGNPGKRKLPQNEPQPRRGAIERPEYLSDPAKAVWDRLSPELIELGILKPLDVTMFAAFCALVAEFEADPAGTTASRIAQMRSLGSCFGVDPSSRTRLSIPEAKEKSSPWDEFAAG